MDLRSFSSDASLSLADFSTDSEMLLDTVSFSDEHRCLTSTPINGPGPDMITLSRMVSESECRINRILSPHSDLWKLRSEYMEIYVSPVYVQNHNKQVNFNDMKMMSLSLNRNLLSRRLARLQKRTEKIKEKNTEMKQWHIALKKKITKHMCTSSLSESLCESKKKPKVKGENKDITRTEGGYFMRSIIFRQSKRWKQRCGRSIFHVNSLKDAKNTHNQEESSREQVLLKNFNKFDMPEALFQTVTKNGKKYTWC